jgi:hypothetical protein
MVPDGQIPGFHHIGCERSHNDARLIPLTDPRLFDCDENARHNQWLNSSRPKHDTW